MPVSTEQSSSTTRNPWFETALGAALLQCEEDAAARLLERVFGFVCVSIGSWWPVENLQRSCPIRRHIKLAPDGGELISPLDNLALASDSIDAVLLPHTLEFVASPQRLLREVDRVLVGEGHVLIFGFNPWSAWSARRLVRSNGFPEQGRPLTARRLADWLGLLGFEILATEGVFRRPPLAHAGMLGRLERLETQRWLPLPGNAYAILARKHIYAMTPLKPAWERRRRLTAGLPTPASGMNKINKQ